MNNGKTVHDFGRSLAYSDKVSAEEWWEDVYRQLFVDYLSMERITQDGWAQRGGIDRIITLLGGLTLNIDEKVRDKSRGDILLEIWSDKARRTPGWVQKSQACHYIAVAYTDKKVCYLLDFQLLRAAWLKYGERWQQQYGLKEADNGRYITVSVCVPIDVLYQAMSLVCSCVWAVTDADAPY